MSATARQSTQATPCPSVMDDVSKSWSKWTRGRTCRWPSVVWSSTLVRWSPCLTAAGPGKSPFCGVGIIRGRCSLTLSSRVAAFGSHACLATLQLAGFRPGTRRRWMHWMATKASQITKPVAGSRPQHVFRLAEGVRALRSLSLPHGPRHCSWGNDSSASRNMPGHRYSDTISRSYRDMARAAPQRQTWFVWCCGTRGAGVWSGAVSTVRRVPAAAVPVNNHLALLRGVFLSPG